MEPPALAAGPAAPVRAAPGASADLLLPVPRGTQPFTYHWSRAGASLDDRFTTSEDAGGVRLTVSAAQTGDSGVYTLQASNAAGSDTSKIRLEVSAEEAPTGEDPPSFLRRLQDLTVKVGSRTRFLVEIISSTECKVTWYRNERRLLEAERVALARDGNFWCADVAAVSVDDAGRWTCTAENAGGRASCSAHLNVLVPKAYKRPEFVEELRALLTEQGTVSLECKVVGVPTPVLRWFKDSREIKAGDVFALTANAEDPTSLGTYTCEAVNCMGRAYSSSKVHVVGRASREGSARPTSSGMTPEPPPIFTKELEDAHVKVCEHLTLGCHIVVPPWPRSVVWYNKEGKVEPGERYHVLEDGVGGYLLEIPSTEWADEGEWKCVATSAGGRVGISTCYVAMDVPKNYRKPRFMENLQAVLTEEGLVSFECKVVGFPTPVLSWFKDGQELKPGDVYQLTGTNSLGSYCCIARNCMGQASSSAELTVEDIQNQLNEEEKLQLFSKNQAPKYLQGLKSVEAKIDEPFRFTVRVAIPPEPSVLWYRDDQPVDETTRCHLEKEEKGFFNLDIQNLEFLDQAEWKCVAVNDFGHSVTSCFLKLIIPRHYKKPRFLENLQAILSDEGAVNLECKVIGVPQPVLKWYKDGEELKPGDIHRIISGQDGTCCLGTYTCEAQNCMGIAASSASLLGFDDSIKTKKKITEEQPLQRNLSLSTIHEERTSQMYDTPVGDITLDDKGEISFSFDGKEVSVSLYETPDLTEEEALQIVEMYADQLSENVTEHNVVELPPLRFVKETSTSGNLLMEAIIIDVSPDYFAAPEEDLRTEADVEDLSIADENGIPQLSLDQEIEISGENYLEKTMALLTEEKSDFAAKSSRKKSDSQRSADDFFSLSRDLSLSEEKRDDDTHVSESELQSFASARSSAKVKSKSSKPSGEEGQESSEPTKTILMKEEIAPKVSKNEEAKLLEHGIEAPVIKPKRERRTSRGSRRSSTSSEKSISKSREELLRLKMDFEPVPSDSLMSDEEFKNAMNEISTSLTKVINDVQLIERDIILKSELMSSAATASRSLEIISSLISPLSELHSIADAAKESISESKEVTSSIFNSIPQPLKALQQSLTIIEKCIDMESDNKTLVKKTCVAFVEICGSEIQKVIEDITSVTAKKYIKVEDKVVSEIDTVVNEMCTAIQFSTETIKARNLLTEASEMQPETPTQEIKHLRDTQKAVFELKGPLNSLLRIVKSAESGNILNLSKIKHSEVIMNDMSASIQDLQTALEQIETLSVKESSSSLNKYNTEVIETVMDSVLKLRGSFEQLSTEPHTEEDKYMLTETLSLLHENLTEISHKIETVDRNIGQFDILQSENKLDVLQKMAQILIALENNLPRLETMPIVKSHMATFHKNLTKILEKVIESNDAKKYQTMIEICDTVNIINSSIKNLDAENVLPLASLSNTLKIIQTNLVSNIFESELNSSIVNNISNVLVGIQEAINTAEEMSLQIDSEYIQEFSAKIMDEAKVNVMLEHIDNTIAAVNIIKVIEITQELQSVLMPALENLCPNLEELRRCVASVCPSGVEQDEHISEISETSFAETIATPLCELNQNIIVLNQLIIENIDLIKENIGVVTAIAEPLHELHTNLEILQQDVISQCGDDLTPYEVSINMASVVQNLHSCIVMIHEQIGVEGAEDMSTLEDISGIKTSADTLPSDRLVLPAAEETVIEQSLLPLTHEIATTATAQTLQMLNQHIMVLQTPEVIEALDTLSEISDYSSLKSIMVGLGDLHTGIEGILHPIPIESSIDLEDAANILKLAAIAEPMQEIQQSLSVLDSSNIPVYENILALPAEKVQSVFQNISELKKSLEQCMSAVLPAMEFTNNTIDISNKVSTLREVCEQLKYIFDTSKDVPSDNDLPAEVKNLETVVNSLIDATDVSKDIKIDQVKCITEELYLKVLGVQEDIIQFTTQSPNKTSQEAKLINMVTEVEKSIAVLEQYDFIDLSRASDIRNCISPQIAAEINSESLAQIDDIAENAVNVLQDSYKEIPIADLMIVEDFFKTCKNEFTILRCLISKATSHKQIIRLLQEFNSLQDLVNSFTTKRLELRLSDDVNECLTNFMIHADECLRNARTSLIKIVDSQSDMLIKIPITQLESIKELKYVTESKTNTAIANVVKTLCDVVETSKRLENTLQIAIVEELSQPNQLPTPSQEEITLMVKMDDFAIAVDAQSKCIQINDSSEKVLDKLKKCISKHHDYKDASGIGKTLVILKCLAECTSILQEQFTEKKIELESLEMKGKENSLKEVLTEMLQPLQALQTQLANVQEQILSGVEEDSISIDISTTESIMQTMTELHKDIVQKIELDKQILHSEDDMFMIQEVDKEIHSIQHNIKSIEHVQGGQAVIEITKPMQEIEKSLQTVLFVEKDTLIKEMLPKEVSAELLYHIDQYIELITIVEEISAVIKLEDIKETFDIARELKESIVSFDINVKTKCSARAEQSRLAQELQTALFSLQMQVIERTHELAPSFSANALQRIAQVTAQLQANLVAVTGMQIPLRTPATLIQIPTPIEITQSHLEAATSSGSVVSNIKDSKSFEQTGSVDKETLEKQSIEQDEGLKKITKATQDDVAAVNDTNLQENYSSSKLASLEELAGVGSSEILNIKEAHINKTETDLFSIEIVNPENVLVPDLTTERYLENEEVSDSLKPLNLSKVALSTVQVNLLQHITEYVSEDIVQVVNEISSAINNEEIKKSLNTAHELKECIAAILTGTNEETVGKIADYDKQKSELAQSLEDALSILSKDTLENLHELVPSIDKDTAVKIVTIIDNLKSNLAFVKATHQLVIQPPNIVQQEFKTEIETAELLTKDSAETLQQAQLSEVTIEAAVEETKTDTADSTTLISVEPILKTVVSSSAPISTELSEGFIETTAMAHGIVSKQCEQAAVEKCETGKTNEEISVGHVVSIFTPEKAIEISQEETCVGEISHDAMLQDVNISEIDCETAAASNVAVAKDETTASAFLEKSLTQDNAELDLIIGTEENVEQVTATSDLITKDEIIIDSFQVLSDAIVAAEPYVSELIVPSTSGTAVPPEAQTTEISIKTTTETLSQNTNALLPDGELQIIYLKPIAEEFQKAVLIAKDLQSYLTSSQINTADESKHKLREEFCQVDLIQQIQKALSSVPGSLFESNLKPSTSYSYEQQIFANMVRVADKLSIALSSETISQTAVIDSSKGELQENPRADVTIENIALDNMCITDVQENKPVSSSQNGQLVQICKHKSLRDLVDEFVDCFSELTTSSKETFDLSTLTESIEQNVSEIVSNETTQPFEEFFDSPTLADKLPSAELIAADVRETTVLEYTKNLEKTDKNTESALISFSDILTSAVTNEMNVPDKVREKVVVLSNIENLLPGNSSLINIEESSITTHENIATQKYDASSYDVEPVLMKEALIIDLNSECPVSEIIVNESTLAEKLLSVEINNDVVDIPKTRDHVIKFVTENDSESLYSSPSEATKHQKNKAYLMKHIKEYIASEDVMETAQGFSSALASHTNLQNSLQIAHQLHEVLKLPQISMENTKQELMLKFHSELCCTQSQLSDCVCEFGSMNKENLEKVASIITILKDEINELILTSNEILQEVMNEVNEFFTDHSAEHDRINQKLETKILTDLNQDVKLNEPDDAAALLTDLLPVLELHTDQLPNVPQQINIDVKMEESEHESKQKVASEDIKSYKTTIDEVLNFDERGNLIQHIDAFIADEMTEIMNEISYITNTEALKETVAVARKLRESVTVMDYSATVEETSSLNDNVFREQVQLAQTLQDAFSLWHMQKLEIADVIAPDTIDKFFKVISNLQDSLTSSIIISDSTSGKIQIAEIGDEVDVEEQNSMEQLEKLLQDVNIKMNIAPANGTLDVDDSESLKNTLDEVQTVIIKLKREYDDAANDTLNETLDDLECSVRSVQLQISEESPPELLSEACATLHLLVDNMNATQQVQIPTSLKKSEKIEFYLDKCSNETEATVKLLDVASKLDIKENSNLENIVRKLKNIKDSLKFLRESFLVDADTVIENGVVIVQCLNQVEENIFSLDGEIEMADGIPGDTRDCITSAVHSVYGSISNMRSTVSSVQKRFMFENYGKPSESLLHSIKNVVTISSFDDGESKASWKRFSKSLRKVLNHFEDIKFYINLDKTARLPSDAAFTKIILEDLKDNIVSLLVPRTMLFDSKVLQKVSDLQKCVDIHIKSIESDSSLHVINKIPMFKNIATETLSATNLIKIFLEKSKYTTGKATEDPQPPGTILTHKQESREINQDLQKVAVATETKLVEPNTAFLSEITRDSASVDENKDSEIVELTSVGENEPSTSYLVGNNASNTSRNYLTETEILVPLEKQVLVAETKTEMHISETSTDLENTLPLDPKNLAQVFLQSLEIDERKQAQTTADVQLTDMSDSQVKIKQKVEFNVEKDTKNISKAEIEYDIAESSIEVETDDMIVTPGCSITQIQETKIIEMDKEDGVIASSSHANTMKTYTDQVKILDQEEINTDMDEEFAIQEKLTDKTSIEEDELKNMQLEKINSNEEDEKKNNQDLDEAKLKQDQKDKKLALHENQETLKAEQDTELSEKELGTQNQITKPDKESTEQKPNIEETIKMDEMDEKLNQNEEKSRTLSDDENANLKEKEHEICVTEEEVKIDRETSEKIVQEDEFQPKAKAATQDYDLEHKEEKPNVHLYDTEEQEALATKNKTQKVADKDEQQTEINRTLEQYCANQEKAVNKNEQEKKELSSTEETRDRKPTENIEQEAELKPKDGEIRSQQEKHDAELMLKQVDEERDLREKTDAVQATQSARAEEKEQNEMVIHCADENKVKTIEESKDTAVKTEQKEVSKYETQEKNFADLKQNQDKMERSLKEEPDALQTKSSPKAQPNEENTRLAKEKADAAEKDEQEARVVDNETIKTKTEQETTEKFKQEPELKKEVTYAQQEMRELNDENKNELKQKQDEKDQELKEKADTLQAIQDANQKQQTTLLKKAADADLKEKEVQKASESKAEGIMTTEDKEAVEKTKQETELIEIEEQARTNQERNDLKEIEAQKASETKAKRKKSKEDKDTTERAKQETELKQIEDEAHANQKNDGVELKPKQEETEHALKEGTDALQAKQDAEQNEKTRLFKDAEEQTDRVTKTISKTAKEVMEAAEKAKQETELKEIEKETRANQKMNDAELKQKKQENERALKEEADALQAKLDAEQKEKTHLLKEVAGADLKKKEEQKARGTKVENQKAKEDKKAAEKTEQENKLKQIEEARAIQEKNDAELKEKQKEKERALKEEADALQAKQDAEQKEQSDLVTETPDADFKEKEAQKDRDTKAKREIATEDKDAAEKVKQETELRQTEEKTRENQEKNDAELKQKQNENERALQEKADALQAKHNAEQNEQSGSQSGTETADADFKEKEAKKDRETKAKKDKAAAEKIKQETELKQAEEKARANQEKNDAEVNQKQEEKKSAFKEEADVLQAKHDAEQSSLVTEKADADFKEKETQKDRETKAKRKKAQEDKDTAEKARQETEVKQIEEEDRGNQEKIDSEHKRKQEEKERALKEEVDALQAKQDAEQKEKSRLMKEAADADLKEKEEQKACETKAKRKKAKEDKDAAEKAKQETELKQKEEEARANQEKNDVEFKQKQKENERALKEEADALQAIQDAEQKEKSRLLKQAADADLKEKEEQKASETKAKCKKAKEDKDAAEKAKQETELKQKEEEARLNQEKNDVELKQKQEEKERALKEEADALQAKQDAEQKEKSRLLKEAADADLKEKEEQKTRETKVKRKKAKEDKDAAEKAKQETELKQKEEEARLNQEKNDVELKRKQEEKERALKEEADALQAKQDAEQKEKSKLLKEAADADFKEKEEQKACETKAKRKKAKEDKDAAVKAKQETELKQKEDEARANQEKNDVELKQKQEEKERALKEEADALQAKQDAEQKEKSKLLKEAADADFKEKEEQKACETKAKRKKAKEDKDAAVKAKQETELKQKEDEARANQEKNDVELKQKQEEKERALKEEADALQAKQDAEQKEKSRLLKEAADADLKEKEEQKTREVKRKKAKEDKDAAEKAKQETELKQKEEEARLNQEKNDVELKRKQEEKERALKEEADALQAKQDAEQKEKSQLLKEAADADLKEKEKQKTRETKKQKAKEDKDAAEKAKQETELKQKDEEARLNQEKNDVELKQKQEEKERALKEEADALQAKQDAEQKEKSQLLKEAADADLKEKEEQKTRETKKQKAKEDKDAAEKAKQETELKQKEEEARANKEKNDFEFKQKQEEKERALKEEADALQAKQDAEQKEKSRLLKEAADADLKEKETQKDRETKAKRKKAQEDKDTVEKAKQETELQQKEEEARANQEKNDVELKQKQEEKERALKEEADALQAKQDAEQKEKSKLLKQAADVDLKEKEEQKTRITKIKIQKAKDDKEVSEKTKVETELKQKQEEKERALKDESDALQSKQNAEKKEKKCLEETNVALKEKEKQEARASQTKSKNKKREKEENKVDSPQKELINLNEILKKTAKHTEILDKSERRDDELHIYKEDSDRLAKKDNNNVYHKVQSGLNHEEHYIREYQYEPTQIGHKLEVKEKPRFVDHNHRDYTMEFARPSGYREKSFDVNKTDSLGSHDYLGRNAAIYRAQTLVLDSQLRSSTHLLPDPYGSRTSEPLERRSEIRHRSKAHSEARSITSDKRTGVSRDSKRKPVFSTYLTDRTAVEGSRVKLTCSVLSSSDPTVTWYKNGVELDNKLKYRTKFMDGLITMEVLNAVPSDSAEYSCTIQNENGAVNSSASLKVYPSFEASPIPPTFTRSIRDTFHLAENELVLECRIRGQPLPTITWLKDDKSISTNSRYQAYYLADGVCRLAIEHPSPEDSGKYTCKAENSVWSDQITHIVNFTGKERRVGPNVATIEKSRFDRQAMESRRPHFTNVLSDYKVATGGTIGLQVEIRGAPTRVEWLREGCSVTEVYRNAKTFVEQELYTLALSDVTEKESGMYTCRAWSSQCHVDMNAAITVVQPTELDGKPAIIVGRPEKGILISVGEDINISFRVRGEPKPKVVFMKGIRDITTSQRVCKMTSDDYVKFTLKRSVVSDAGTYCILARNAYGCDRAFVTVVVRQRASSDNLISDWTYPTDESTLSTADRKYKSVPERIPGVPCVIEGGNNWISLGWPKSEPGQSAPVLAYKVESWLLGKEGGARWVELGITPLTSFDAFNLKQGEEYHFRVTPRNRYGWGESVQTASPAGVGLAGDRPEFAESLPGQLKVLVGETANLTCSVKGTPTPEMVWMKNGHEIEDEDRRLSSSFNGIQCSLTIKDINIEDEARYSCEATNVHGRASTYARLAVVTDRCIWEADAKLKRERSADVEGDYPPQFTMRLRDRRVQATYPVRLTCQVIGSPDPRITWFKDGGEVTPDNRRSHFQDEHFHTLEIAPTTLEDGGVYEAMARNSSGAVSCHCSLVVDKGIRAYVAPEFCCGLEPLYRLTDGEELRISAVVEAYPSVGVTWYRDGVRLRPSRRAIMTLDRDGQIELALASVTTRDAGVYSCTASNEVGRASTSGKVEVVGTYVTRAPPVFISPDEPYSKEPMFIRKPRSSEAREGDTVIIACEVVGDPKPDVYWLRDFLKPDYYRDSSHFKRMGDGPEYRFEIPHAKLDYTGAYSVVAKNQHGEAKAVISLQILAKDPSSSDDAHNIRYGLVEVLPRFSKELTDLLSCDGDAVEFECRVSGHPEPTVRWFHYNELIRDSADFETVFDDETARLKIKQVTAEDEGTYTCEAANNLGKVTSSACLVVYPPGEPNTLSQRLRRPPAFLSAASTPRSTPRSTPARSVSRTPGPETRRLCSPARTLAPSFYTYPFNKVAEEGDSVSLQCAIKGNPAPWATWDKDGVIITPSSRTTIKEKDDVLRILEIDEVTIDDVGVYRITIENEFGRQEASARIEVITQKGKFYAGVRAVSPSPRKSLTYRGRRPSTPRQD